MITLSEFEFSLFKSGNSISETSILTENVSLFSLLAV